MYLKHVLRASQFGRQDLEFIYHLTNRIRQFDKHREGLLYLRGLLSDKRAMLYFTQVSTRTFLSFQSACYILGLQPLEIRDPSTSSEVKGEDIHDSIRTFSSYVDLIIMRSPVAGLCDRTAAHLDQTPRPVPIINAGSGPDEHPTQAVLDMYTIMRSFKGPDQVDGKTFCFVGDLQRGRTVRSLAKMLCQFHSIKMLFVSPSNLKMKSDLRSELESYKIDFTETCDFEGAICQANVIYMTRLQDEYKSQSEDGIMEDHECKDGDRERDRDEDVRRDGKRRGEGLEKITPFSLTRKHLDMMASDCIIMHPLPRRDEIDRQIDNDPRAMYWRQERNGMWTRVALIAILMGAADKVLLPHL